MVISNERMTKNLIVHIGKYPFTNMELFHYTHNIKQHIHIPYGYDLPKSILAHIKHVVICPTYVSCHQKWLYEYYGSFLKTSFKHFQTMLENDLVRIKF